MIQTTINDAETIGGAVALLANRYRVVRQLGQGGMGSVYLAEDTKLDNKLFALKMLPAILVANKRAYQQLKAEALVTMKLVHPNIVQLRAFEEEHGNPFLVMDYIEGRTLDDYLGEKGTLSEDETVKLLTPIAAALDYAHGKGVVHRDVKPGNVMIAKDGTPFILDFGIAREIQETMTRVTGKLSSGTLLYMSPEQLRGLPPASSQDVYSFAAMVYECLKGEPPFVRGAIEDQIKNEPPSPLPGGPRSCAAAVMAGLAKKPEDRPPTCAAVLGGSAVAQADAGRSERKAGGAGKVLAIAALLAALAVGGYFAWPRNNAEAKVREEKNIPVVAEPRAKEVRPKTEKEQPSKVVAEQCPKADAAHTDAEAQKLMEAARHSMPRVGPLEYHFVRTGDTLDKIAASNGLAVSVLRELNGLTNDHLSVIQPLIVAPSRWGTVKSISEIVEWYRKAAAEGDAAAQFGMGVCYFNGAGVAKDLSEAVKWFRKAAEQGCAMAQLLLGFCYVEGDGVAKDAVEAVKWYRKAAEQGDVYASSLLGICYVEGDGVAKDMTEAVKWVRKAAEQGLALAQTLLGTCYEVGAGVTIDMTEAVKWYRKAAEQGEESARDALKRLGR